MRAADASGRDAIALHGAFALAAIALVAAPIGSLGARVTLLVALYHAAVVTVARARGHAVWLRVWGLTATLSVLQVLPDAFLCSLGVLSYGDIGAPKLGGVSVFMAGMWAIPLFPIVLAARHVEARRGLPGALWTAAGLSLLVLGGAEDPAWALDLWRAKGVAMVSHTAIYVLPAETVLGVAAFVASRRVERARAATGPILVAAAAVMLLFTGAASIAYVLIEHTPRVTLPS